jgi:hypothetical protein
MALQSLPYELLLKIINFISLKDSLALFSTNSTLQTYSHDNQTWKSFLVSRYSLKELIQNEHHRITYKTLFLKNSFVEAPRLSICWGADPQYWNIEQDQNSNEGIVASLLQVSWLDVFTTFKNIQFGTYRPIFRLKLSGERTCASLKNAILECCVSSDDPLDILVQPSTKRPLGESIENSKDKWVDVELDPITLKTMFSNVTMKLYDHSGLFSLT